MDKIYEVNRAARVRAEQVEDIVESLDELVDLQQKVGGRFTDTHRELRAFVGQLTQPEAKIDGVASPDPESLLSDGAGDDACGDEQRTAEHTTTNTEDTE
jgi:hypothetical protein